MKILFVCHRLPYPPNRGGKIRPFNMIRHLGQKHSVTVASLAFTEDELKAAKVDTKILVIKYVLDRKQTRRQFAKLAAKV